MRKRIFYLEHLIQMLLLTRYFYKWLVPLPIFILIAAILLRVKYQIEGFTILTFMLIALILLEAIGQSNQLIFLQFISSILGGLLFFFPLNFYQLPQPLQVVGFRQIALKQNLQYFQFFPLEHKNIKMKTIKWNYQKQISKMLEHQFSHHQLKRLANMFMSYADKHYLRIGEGPKLNTNKSIAFSHGKGATPFYYSSLMMHFAGKHYRIGAVQHTEIPFINMNNREKIKKYREDENERRGEQMIQVLKMLDNEQIVIMAHSYGCATVIQAYYMLDPSIKRKVTHLILLDPWFFPLKQQVFSTQIQIPVLVIANQDFVDNEDIYLWNNDFLKKQRAQYIIWKEAHHLHQTDIGFINGNLLGVVKNSKSSREQLQININAIEAFLRGERVEGRYGDKDLGRNYQPSFYHPIQMSTW